MAMPIDAPPQERILITINEVDVKNRAVHAKDKMNADLQVSWRDTGSTVTVVPAAGERWTARREGYIWYLENRLDDEEAQAFVETLAPGDQVLASTGSLFLRAPAIFANSNFETEGIIFSLGGFEAIKDSEFDSGYKSRKTDDAEPRFQARIDGRLEWGDGISPFDVSLYRVQSDFLQTEDLFTVQRPTADSSAFAAWASLDSNFRFRVQADGKVEWGDGTNAPDISLERVLPGFLRLIDAELQIRRDLTTQGILGGFLDGDAFERYHVDAGGKQSWGPGSSGADTNLYRSGAGVLQSDNRFRAVALHAFGGAPSDPLVGETFFDSDSACWLFWNGKFWQPMHQTGTGQQLGYHAYLFDDFIGQQPLTADVAGLWMTQVSGTGAAAVGIDATGMVGAPVGVVRLDTGSTASGTAAVITRHFTVNTNTADFDLIYVAALIYIDVLSDGTNRFAVLSGVSSSGVNFASVGAENGWGFRYIDSTNAGAWQAITYDADGAITQHFSGETVQADKWYLLETMWDRVNATVSWWINDTLLGTLTGVVPGTTPDFPSAFTMRPTTGIEKMLGTTERTLHVDAMTAYWKMGAKRYS